MACARKYGVFRRPEACGASGRARVQWLRMMEGRINDFNGGFQLFSKIDRC
jgi:hypothetical protein